MRRSGNYLQATCHPWSCVVFVLPLLLIYEAGLHLLGASQPEVLRNGADGWLRLGLAHVGLSAAFWAPALLAAVLVVWSLLRRGDRPDDFLGIWVGMTVESVLFALGLWALSRGLWPFLEGVGIQLALAGPALDVAKGGTMPEPAVEQIISFVGAGVYEETLFRLLLFSGSLWILKLADLPLTGLFAAVASALLFAAAHNFGPYGENYDGYVFLFRTLAGIYFTVLYQFRGFGIAVGAHTGYDVLVGVLVTGT